MVFGNSAQEEGPFHLSSRQRAAKQFDVDTERTEVKKKTKAKLRQELKAMGYDLRRGDNHNLDDLQLFAITNAGIPLEQTLPVINTGWIGKPKGLLQILWERGWIDPTKRSQYVVGVKKDKNGNVVEASKELSLKHILSERRDFKSEVTALQFLGEKLGVVVDSTPKFHAEIAGEGIEYCWAFAKLLYRHKPLKDKKTRAKFKELVKKCTSHSEISKERVCKFAGQARAYMCTYHQLSEQRGLVNQQVEPLYENEGVDSKEQQLLFSEIKRLMKKFKCHLCALVILTKVLRMQS